MIHDSQIVSAKKPQVGGPSETQASGINKRMSA